MWAAKRSDWDRGEPVWFPTTRPDLRFAPVLMTDSRWTGSRKEERDEAGCQCRPGNPCFVPDKHRSLSLLQKVSPRRAHFDRRDQKPIVLVYRDLFGEETWSGMSALQHACRVLALKAEQAVRLVTDPVEIVAERFPNSE